MSGTGAPSPAGRVGGPFRALWRLVKGTGVEAAGGRDPEYLSWFLGVPLVTWSATILIVGALVWASDSQLVPFLILAVGLLNVGATSRVLVFQGREIDGLNAQLSTVSDQPPPIRLVHEAWRARSATWGYLAALVTLSFLALIRFLPTWALSRLFPANLLPLYDLAVLALTVAMIAVLSQYTSRTAAADARATSRDLRKLSSEIMGQSERASAQLSSDLAALASRLTESLAQTTRETNTVLANLTNSVHELAASAAAQAEVVRRAQAATEEALTLATRATREHADAIRGLERARAEEIAAEAERLRPRLALRLRVQGTILHHVWLDLYDGASQAVGLVVEVTGGRDDLTFNVGNLPTRIPRAVDLGDVSRYPDDGPIRLALQYSDLAGRQYRARQEIHFTRFRTVVGTTSGWRADPEGWVWVVGLLDIPVEARQAALPVGGVTATSP